jgi:hypothetical protein
MVRTPRSASLSNSIGPGQLGTVPEITESREKEVAADCQDWAIGRSTQGGRTMVVSIREDLAESLAEEITRLVQSRTGGQIVGLNVSVAGADVIISGRTTTYYLKQLATHAALDLAGRFATLTNDIVVS